MFKLTTNQIRIQRLLNYFKKKKASISGIHFNNKLIETEAFNYFNFQYIYMGGGVSVGDFDNQRLTRHLLYRKYGKQQTIPK